MAAMIVTPGQTVPPDDWAALFAQHKGAKSGTGSTGTIRPPTKEEQAAADDAAASATSDKDAAWYADLTNNPIRRYYAEDGSYVEARQAPNGMDYQVIAYQPSQRFQQEQAREVQAQTPAQQQTARQEAERKKNAALPGPNPNGATEAERRGQDPRSETDAERAARADATIKQQGADAVAAEARARQAKIDEQNAANTAADNKRADAEAAQRAAQANKPDVRLTQDGTKAVITYPDGRVETKDTGLTKPPTPGQIVKGGGANGEDVQAVLAADGKSFTYQPIPGATVPAENRPGAAPGPSMPELVAGMSEQQLIAYHNALSKDPSLTPQQRKDRFSEAVQIANMGVNEANIAQRERESSRNSRVTVATNKLNFMQNGLDGALKFVMGFNSKLPAGSDAGAKAFTALMGINAIQLAMSGINDVQTGQQIVPPVLPRTTTVPTIANPANPNDVNKAQADLAQHPAGIRTGSEMTGTGVDAPVIRPTAAPPPVPAVAPAPSPVPQLGQGQDASSPTGGVAPPTPGEPGGPPLQTTVPPLPTASQSDQPDLSTLRVVPDASGGTDTFVSPDGKMYSHVRGQMVLVGVNPGAYQTATAPAATPYTPPPTPAPVSDTQQPSDMGILGQYMPQPTLPTVPLRTADYGPSPEDHPAMLHSIAATTPPWRISADQYEKMKRAGVPDEVIGSVPGQGVAA